MTYTVGGLIQAADYNGFVSTNSANVNGQWGTGSGGLLPLQTGPAWSVLWPLWETKQVLHLRQELDLLPET